MIACARELSAGRDTRARRLKGCRDERSLLTVEPLRWALSLRPRWVALEQVPPVLELFSLFAELLGSHGYRSAVGLLSAERYGVPQARKRAFLIASLDGEVELPEPTHRSFNPRRHDVPEAERHLPGWVSMAKALGWGEQAVMRTNRSNYGRHPDRSVRSLDRPSYTLVGSTRLWTIEPHSANVSSDRLPPASRSERLPAPCARHSKRREAAREGETPSGGVPGWAHRRPATTLLGDPRVSAPGSWPRCGRRAALVRGRAVRVTVEQAGVLQGFRHDYPWRGSRMRRFAQIGNAVCPPLARHVLREAMRPSLGRGRGRRVRGGRRG